jgi:alpha-mannosidase
MALTLLRSVGWLSRADMSVRRGHAGPGLPTPEAQCIGEFTCHYALVPHQGDWQAAFDAAYAFNAPLRAVDTPAHDGTLSSSGSMVEVSPRSLVVSAVKEAEDGSGLIVRFWNSSLKPCEAVVKCWAVPSRAALCNLAEREIEALTVSRDGSVRLPVRGREIVTLLVAF